MYRLEFSVIVTFLLTCVRSSLISAHMYSVPFLFLLGIEFLQFVGLGLVRALIWFKNIGIGLTPRYLDLSYVY